MNSSELYANILTNLSSLRNFMVTQDWIDAVSAADPATQKKAFNASFAVGHGFSLPDRPQSRRHRTPAMSRSVRRENTLLH